MQLQCWLASIFIVYQSTCMQHTSTDDNDYNDNRGTYDNYHYHRYNQ